MDISDVAAFVKVVQAGSFTQAARALEAPKSTISAKVAALEKRLGVTLLQRTTRKLNMTEAGESFFRACSQALAEIEEAENALAQSQSTPQGRLVVTAPVNLGRFIAQFLAGFLEKYPGIHVDLLLTNRYVDLIGEGVDVAIRGGTLKSSSLIAKRVATNESLVVASPGYAAKLKSLTHPRDLANYHCLRFAARNEWTFHKNGKAFVVPIQSRVSVDEFPTLQALAEEGLGLALIPNMLVHDALAEGRLVRVLADWKGETNSVSLVYPAQRYQHPKVRAFVDACAVALKAAYAPLSS
ncbi:MAG TPA: LysR family transcriptional regulator [Oligoflexus sp.]|uniref:LysR family transcriptional regulator n=1 Tax=Oligoflexus sp. TaxID=1971216 RepID=UPI002D644E3E|nr:LysR family transcriptional regulator [Oligoflexus sp.]HYX38827.1 LysR family transcriptional regulator [Oligoflexus sp.]